MGKVKKAIKKEQAVDETAVATKTKKNDSQTKPQLKEHINFADVLQRFSAIAKVSTDKFGFTSLKAEDGTVITYLMGRKDGKVSHYVKNGSTWKVSEVFENQKQVDDLFAKVSKEIEARKSWKSALIPRYVHGEFITDDRQQMVEHLKAQL
jgi:hypothetical protein